MAVRCPNCDRLSRDEAVCEWCRAEIPPEARPMAKSGASDGEEGDIVAGTPQTLAVDDPASTGSAVDLQEPAAPEAGRADDEVIEAAELTAVEQLEERQDRDTLVILLLILFQLVLTLYLGRLSSWWSATGIAWLVVGYGVKEREMWALALPLVLFTLDIALLLFGVGPRERAGFPDLGPLDFFLYVLRMGIWVMIWRLKEELA